jgi:hypothetical protein
MFLPLYANYKGKENQFLIVAAIKLLPWNLNKTSREP